MEAYIDHMVVKSKRIENRLANLGETFSTLRKHKVCLNVSKCSFRFSSGKFLGYLITHHGIELNPEQIRAINGFHPPRNPKEVQRLTRIMVALNKFISRSVGRCHPFFKLLHKWKDFQWTKECMTAFEDLKKYLANPPILSKLAKEEVLYAYLVVTKRAVNFVLVRNEDGIRGPSTMPANPYKRLRCAIYPWKKQYWLLCTPLGNSLITSSPILWLYLLNCPCRPW